MMLLLDFAVAFHNHSGGKKKTNGNLLNIKIDQDTSRFYNNNKKELYQNQGIFTSVEVKLNNHHHTINRAAFVCLSVCLSVCSLSPPRSFDRSSPNLVGVCRWTSELPLRGSFSKRSTGRRVNESLSLSTILYRDQPHTTHLQRHLLLAKAAESNSAPFAVVHVNDVCRWTWQLLLRGSFSKTSTGRRGDGSTGQTGQRVTFTFTILYMIADDARLTPPRCKKHTGSTG